jgi:hypothetical protein
MRSASPNARQEMNFTVGTHGFQERGINNFTVEHEGFVVLEGLP